MSETTTKKSLREVSKSIDEGLSQINSSAKLQDEINAELLKQSSSSELASFVMSFVSKKDCQLLIKVLSKIQEQPQLNKRKNSFETLWCAAEVDGERNLFRKFMNLIIAASNADIKRVEELLNK